MMLVNVIMGQVFDLIVVVSSNTIGTDENTGSNAFI